VTSALTRILPPTPLERWLAIQCVLSAFATGSFLTATAVFFTRIVGLSGAEVGLGMSVAAAVGLAVQVPLGRITDRVGARELWVLAAAGEAVMYFVWPLIGGLTAMVAMLAVVTVFEVAGRNARNVYRIAVFSRETRVRAMAYQRAARNVGYTLGAGAGGVALGIGSREAIIAIPFLTGGLLVLNALMVATCLPGLAHQPHQETVIEEALHGPAAWRNRGFVALAACNGALSSHQVLLNVVVPLWLVERTDAPQVLLAWLFGTNTVLAVLLQVRASRGAETVEGALRAVRRSGWCFVLSCAVIAVTHDTIGWVSIALIWAGHVTITGAELWSSAADWGFTSELSDPRRLGDYQGVWGMGYQVEPIIFPALYTFLALHWGTPGWFVIAAVGVAAAVAAHPAARAAERYLERVGAPANA
jgi:MFS family permease